MAQHRHDVTVLRHSGFRLSFAHAGCGRARSLRMEQASCANITLELSLRTLRERGPGGYEVPRQRGVGRSAGPLGVSMVIGTQHLSGDDWPQYQALAQLGVRHVSANPPGDWRAWTAPLLGDFKARLAELGVALDMVMLPFSSNAAPLNGAPHVFLGPPEARDRELDQICELIRNLSLAGVGAARYNAAFLGHLRTPDRLGRGGARLSSFVFDQLGDPRSGPGPGHLARLQRDQAAWLEVAAHGPMSADDVWERIDYFLARVVPVAEEYRVRLACHPEDPGLGELSFYGLPRVLGTVDGLKKFVELHASPYHGLNFCVGTVAEMLEKPAEEIGAIVRYFGARQALQ